MSCLPNDPRFRLLDHLVGWDASDHTGLTGLDAETGVRLEGGPDGLTPAAVDPFIAPPRISPGCGPCDWYLATKPAPHSLIKVLDGCSNAWAPAWARGCVPIEFVRAVAVAVDRHRIAIADAGTNRVWILLLRGAQVIAESAVTEPRDLSFGPGGELAVAAEDGAALIRITANGRSLGPWPAPLPPEPIARVAHAPDGRLWLVTEAGPGRFHLYAQETPSAPGFIARSLDDLAAAFRRTAMIRSDDAGFCLHRGGPDGAEIELCYDWFGRLLPNDCVSGAAAAEFARQGQLLTHALDSGIPRCRWHRIRIDADIPPGSVVSLAVASSEERTPPPQGANSPDWAAFPAGLPHPDDWQPIAPGQTDALIRQPAGRYLFVRLRLQGDGTVTPQVRRIHIDFPRATSADLLPSVYRDDPAAGEFTERFLSLFDASLETVDATVARFPALLNGAHVHDEVLPWIARFLSVGLDEAWDADTRRRMLRNAPDLFRRRGTREGLARSIRLAFGLTSDPAITEHGPARAWGAVGSATGANPQDARLGRTRLFSKARARVTLGSSQIGVAPVMSYGDPAADPHTTGAFRFSVGLPPTTSGDTASLARLIEGQKPAHTLAHIREGGANGFLLSGTLQLGVDTLLTRPDPKALGNPDLRLSRGTILGGQAPPGPVLGAAALTAPHPFTLPKFCTE